MKGIALLFALFFLLNQVQAKVRYGYASAYAGPRQMDSTGKNACNFNARSLNARWQVFYGAMNEADWNAAGGKKGSCGRCVSVRGIKGQTTGGHRIKPVIVKIVDQCPGSSCSKGSVDFSTTALKAITGYSWDRKKVAWEWVNCSTGKPL